MTDGNDRENVKVYTIVSQLAYSFPKWTSAYENNFSKYNNDDNIKTASETHKTKYTKTQTTVHTFW